MSNNFFSDGQWNFTCHLCGRKEKSGKAVKTWDGFRVCQRHKEVRNPQDLMRGVRGEQPVEWTAPEPPDQYITYCSLRARQAIADGGSAGCMIASSPPWQNAVANIMMAGNAVAGTPYIIPNYSYV